MYDKTADGGYFIPADIAYYGEVSFEMYYKELRSEPFNWLYIDFNTLAEAAVLSGFHCDLVRKGPHYDYLAKLTLKV